MKAEDLFNSISRVDEDLLERSEQNLQAQAADGEPAMPVELIDGDPVKQAKSTRRKMLVWRGAAIAAAAVLVAVGGIWMAKKGIFRTEKPGGLNPTVTPYQTTISEGKILDGQNALALSEETKKFALQTVSYPELKARPSSEDYYGAGGYWDEAKFNDDFWEWRQTTGAKLEELRSLLNKYGSVKAVEAVNQFTFRSMQQLLANRDGANATFSPINIYMMLGMLAEITDGETREQILTLADATSVEDLRERVKALWCRLYQNNGKARCVLGSSLWLRDDGSVNYNQETMKRLATEYFASSFKGVMGSEEYNKAIRDWLNSMTGGLLKDAADGISFEPETVLALATTVLFSAEWQNRMSLAESGKFYGSKGTTVTEYLHEDRFGIVYFGDHFVAVRKWFKAESDASMWFILPNNGVSVDELLSDPQVEELMTKGQYYTNQKEYMVHFTVPKFDVSSKIDLKDALKAMGVTDIFDDKVSDFTPMADGEGYFVSDVKHSARVKIDENGAVAAAFTVVMVEGLGMPPEGEITITLDRPFLYFINSSDDITLFTGIVENPQNVSES